MPKYYRISGLQSAKGKRLNGQACTIHEANRASTPPERVPCWVDGEPDMIAIKRANLERLSSNHTTVTISVKRDSLRNEDVKMTYQRSDFDDPSKVHVVTDPEQIRRYEEASEYCSIADKIGNGLVLALFNALESLPSSPLLIKADDINLVRAINKFATGGDETYTLLELDEELRDFIRGISDECMVLAKFDPPSSPFACPELPLKKPEKGNRRVRAVKKGLFHIYPCACETYFDSLEVRFASGPRSEQEIFHFSGFDGLSYYIEYATQFEQEEKLSPTTLATVDPQVFWQAVLLYDLFVRELEEHDVDSSIVREWRRYDANVQQVRRASRRILAEYGLLDLLPTDEGEWSIDSLQEHKKISMQNAMIAPLCTFKTSKPIPQAVASCDKELLSIYYDSQLEEAFHCIDHLLNGRTDEISQIVTDTYNNNLKTRCCTCHRTDDLQECSGCGKLAYCRYVLCSKQMGSF